MQGGDGPTWSSGNIGGRRAEKREARHRWEGLIKEYNVSLDSTIYGIGWQQIDEVVVKVFVRGGCIGDKCISRRSVVGRKIVRGGGIVVVCA